MDLEALGFTPDLAASIEELGWVEFEPGRVEAVHGDLYTIIGGQGPISGQLTGRLRFAAQEPDDLPVTGDWVVYQSINDGEGIIHGILPRRNLLRRRAAGGDGLEQPVAANIDAAFILQAVDRDFSLSRFERYLTITGNAGIRPILVAAKMDLLPAHEGEQLLQDIKERLPDVSIVALSNETGTGLEDLKSYLHPGKTICLLGSSGVGKSTLINRLAGRELQATGEISSAVGRGKHVTTVRRLVLLDEGGILIDNPGIREVGVTEPGTGLGQTFGVISGLAKDCRFADCSHMHEEGCAVLAALDSGELEQAVYDNFIRLRKEETHYAQSAHSRRKKAKGFNRMVNEAKKIKKQSRGE